MTGREAKTLLKRGDKVRFKADPKQVVKVTSVANDAKEPKRVLVNGSIPSVLVEKVEN